MQRLAKPITEIKDSYDAVVVGSGYGGAIAASRLARMNIGSVALLERERKFTPVNIRTLQRKASSSFRLARRACTRAAAPNCSTSMSAKASMFSPDAGWVGPRSSMPMSR